MASDRMWNWLTFAVAMTMAAGVIAGIGVPAGPGWDFANFYDAGHKIWAGQSGDVYNPFALIEGRPPEGHLAYFGAPISAVLFVPLAWMTPAVAMIVFKIQATAAIVAALWLLYKQLLPAAEKNGVSRACFRALFLGAAAVFQPFWTIYRVGGQTTPLVFLAFVLALLWLAKGRPLFAAAAMTAAVSIKPAFILVLLPIAVLGGARLFLCVAASGVAAGAFSVVTMGWGVHQRFLAHIATPVIQPWVYNSSLGMVVESVRDRIPALGVVGTGMRLAAAGFVVASVLRMRKRIASGAARHQTLLVMSAVLGLVLMPVVWEHYLSILFIPVAVLLSKLPVLGRSEKLLLSAIVLACMTQNLILALWLWERLRSAGPLAQVLAGLWKAAPLMLSTVLVSRYWTRMVEAGDRGLAGRPTVRETSRGAIRTPGLGMNEL